MTEPGRLAAVCRALVAHYPTENWWPADSVFEVMVGAVLVQNTRWENAARAIDSLREAGLLAAPRLAVQSPERLTRVIRPAGCQRVKAPRLRALALWVGAHGGIDRLAGLPSSELRASLLTVAGVGSETADAILCFGFDRPAFVADGYARRWLQRLGLLDERQAAGYERARRAIEPQLAGWQLDSQSLHAAIVQHGQRHCSKRPDCRDCPVRDHCNYIKNSN